MQEVVGRWPTTAGRLAPRPVPGSNPEGGVPLRDGACSLARKEQLEQENPGLRIYLQGFWLAEVPPQLLRRETKVNVLYRWTLGDLLDDVSHLLRTKGHGRRLALGAGR